MASPETLELLWLPVGAGSRIVPCTSRWWELAVARREGREPLTLVHAALTRAVPARVWGRVAPATGEMWTSNSIVAWVLAGLGRTDVRPPTGTRAPGWDAGVRSGVVDRIR